MTSAPAPHPLPVSATRLAELTISDQHRLRRRVDGASKIRNAARRTAVLAEIDGQILAAEQRIANRRASVPAVRYPEELPVSHYFKRMSMIDLMLGNSDFHLDRFRSLQ